MTTQSPLTTESMASGLINTHKGSAEVCQGEAVCKKKMHEILESHGLPNGLFPVPITELGYDKAAGFVWARQKEKTETKNVHINKIVTYDAEIAFFIENKKIKRAIGIKSKVIVWVIISDIYIDEAFPDKIVFQIPQGISNKFPLSAFVIEQEKDGDLESTK